MKELELKAVVPDLAQCRRRVEESGAVLVFEGRLEDRRYDTADRALGTRDHVLRVRVYRDAESARAALDWKGPTEYEDGYKRREELSTSVADGDALAAILDRLGWRVTRAIDREIAQYELEGTMLRFEVYPRMDVLVEVEGSPEGIERAARATGIPREEFTSDRLPDFARRYEARTGERAALCDADLVGESTQRLDDA
jgi:predicted adenylyl cyclase CyaB